MYVLEWLQRMFSLMIDGSFNPFRSTVLVYIAVFSCLISRSSPFKTYWSVYSQIVFCKNHSGSDSFKETIIRNETRQNSKKVKTNIYPHKYNTHCYIARLSLNKMSTVIGWFLVTCPWSNSNASRLGYNCAVVAPTPSLFSCFCYMKV